MYRFISDSHIHSRCSFDGNDSVSMICNRAVQLGLYSITVTDHCECSAYYYQENDEKRNMLVKEFGKLPNFRGDIERSIIETGKAKAMNSNKLKIYTGIELGEPLQDLKASEDVLSLSDFDYILASVHNLTNMGDFYFLEYTEENSYELLEKYFNELLDTAKWNKFDALAHLTYPVRYMKGKGLNIDLKRFEDIIAEILKTLIVNKKSLEINTSGLRQTIGTTLPDDRILKLYKDLGGTYITLGSDAHRWADVCAGIEDGLNLALMCGFSHFVVYDRHGPRLLPIK